MSCALCINRLHQTWCPLNSKFVHMTKTTKLLVCSCAFSSFINITVKNKYKKLLTCLCNVAWRSLLLHSLQCIQCIINTNPLQQPLNKKAWRMSLHAQAMVIYNKLFSHKNNSVSTNEKKIANSLRWNLQPWSKLWRPLSYCS